MTSSAMPQQIPSIPLCTPSSSSSHADQDVGEYRLLELPDDVAKLIEAAQDRQRQRLERSAGDDVGPGAKSNGKRKRRGDGADDDDDADAEREYLIINGRHNDEAVLSTADKTYALREVSQSNSLLLCALDERASGTLVPSIAGAPPPPQQLTMKVNVSSLLELGQIVPRLERITTLLKASAYEGDEMEKKKRDIRKYTPREVRSIVQASDKELQEGYDERCVMLLDGYMRSISPPYLSSLLRTLILILDSNSYLSDRVPIDSTIESLQEDHADLRRSVAVRFLTTWFGSSALGNDAGYARLDMDKISRYLGEQLLKAKALQPMKLSDFLAAWQGMLAGDSAVSRTSATHDDDDDARTPTLDRLRGLYILFPAPPASFSTSTSSSITQTIQYYPKSLLPLEPAPRFQELFLTRPQWLLDELEPFIEDLSVDSKRREALLLRYARAKKVGVSVGAGATRTDAPGSKKAGGGGGTAMAAAQKEITLYSARVRY